MNAAALASKSGRGQLINDIELKDKVKGLIIPATEKPQFGIPFPPFYCAAVSCLTIQEGGVLPS